MCASRKAPASSASATPRSRSSSPIGGNGFSSGFVSAIQGTTAVAKRASRRSMRCFMEHLGFGRRDRSRRKGFVPVPYGILERRHPDGVARAAGGPEADVGTDRRTVRRRADGVLVRERAHAPPPCPPLAVSASNALEVTVQR